MQYNTKIGADVSASNTARENAMSGPRIPSADLHARRISREAEAWLTFARERSRMAEPTLTAKALGATAFSVRHRASSFAVPSKLSETGKHQRVLWSLVSEGVAPWAELAIEPGPDGALSVFYGEDRLGKVQPKHTPWITPLIPFGLGLRLSRVTGHETQGYRLGANVVVAHVGGAVAALRDALDATAGASGDGAGGSVPVSALVVTAPEGTTAPDTDRRARPSVPVHPEHAAISEGSSPHDVVMWRDLRGQAHASVPHVQRHSQGVEWGYLGAGPADLARSVLLALTDEATADALYDAFAHEVIAGVPGGGGCLRAADVLAWADAAQASAA